MKCLASMKARINILDEKPFVTKVFLLKLVRSSNDLQSIKTATFQSRILLGSINPSHSMLLPLEDLGNMYIAFGCLFGPNHSWSGDYDMLRKINACKNLTDCLRN